MQERNHLENLAIDAWIILKCFFLKNGAEGCRLDSSGLGYEQVSGCEISSSHGGEYDVQSCLLGYTAV
jgi:hypothetical protein